MAPTRSTAALSWEGDSVSTRVLSSCFVAIGVLGGRVALSVRCEGHIETTTNNITLLIYGLDTSRQTRLYLTTKAGLLYYFRKNTIAPATAQYIANTYSDRSLK